MKKRLSPNFVTLTLEACHSVYWYKKSLALFLKQHDVPHQYTCSTYAETKRQRLDELFNHLADIKTHNGHTVILNIAQSLVTMTIFPDLLNHEDTLQKLNRAEHAIRKLKVEMDKIDKYVTNTRASDERTKNSEAREKAIQTSRQHFEELEATLKSLCTKIGEQRAGYDFETWFYDLACFFEMEARRPYRDKHQRQIDGSITVEGTTYLVEAKLTKDAVNSSDIDLFYTKVQRKADNTMGIFVSISGYDKNAIETASRDRTPLLLLDYSHLFNLILRRVMTLPEVILRVRRHASQTGEAYLKDEKFSL